MRILSGQEAERARRFLAAAAAEAEQATCARARCGSVVVSEGEVIGRGHNSPPQGLPSQVRCRNAKDSYDTKVTDKTCCIHAEVRALLDALRAYPARVPGAAMYFARLSETGSVSPAGRPYCTLCSKLALEAGLGTFILEHAEGITSYGTEEYNDLSFAYREKSH